MIELLFPRTDAGVLVQLGAVVAVTTSLLVWIRRREVLVFVSGVSLVLLSLIGLRALH